jgi:hypothetical protein
LKGIIDRFAVQAVDDVVPAPGGEDGFPGSFALGASFGGQLEVRNQFGKGRIVDIHSFLLIEKLNLMAAHLVIPMPGRVTAKLADYI